MTRPNTLLTSRPQGFVDDLNLEPGAEGMFFVVREGKLLLNAEFSLPRFGEVSCGAVYPLGRWKGQAAFSAPLEGGVPSGMALHPLRLLHAHLPGELFGLAGLALQVVEFQRTHQFCGVCGSALTLSGYGRARVCPTCGYSAYPRVAPVVIVLVRRGEGPGTEFLLAQSSTTATGIYPTLAGFVEPSETLEDACHREVLEEAGVQIRNVQYAFSQPWPFPHNLMVAFTAEYAGGDLVPQEGEILDLRWFPVTDLPEKPIWFSSSRRLLDEALAGLKQ